MNHERDILSEEERRLLGKQATEELIRGERWLAGRLGPARLPAGLEARLGLAVRREMGRGRAGRLAAVAAGLLLLVGLSLWLWQPWVGPSGPAVKPPDPESRTIARAERALDAYIDGVGEETVKVHSEMIRLDRLLAAPDDNPWDAVLEAVEGPV